MNKIFLSEKDLKFLVNWASENQKLIIDLPIISPVKSIKIATELSPAIMTVIRDGKGIELLISYDGKFIAKYFYEIQNDGIVCVKEKYNKKLGKKILKDIGALKSEDKFTMLKLYLCLMAIMAYGEYLQENKNIPVEQIVAVAKEKQKTKETKRKNRKKTNGFVYILKQTKKGAIVVPKGSHASPQGSFTVRGHFRHYKSGKVVWVDEFMKGTGKVKDKNYKLRKENEK